MPSKGNDAAFNAYRKKFRAEVQQGIEANQPQRSIDNLTSNERIAPRKLRQRMDVVIKPANKRHFYTTMRIEPFSDALWLKAVQCASSRFDRFYTSFCV